MERINILIADDHGILREGLVSLLEQEPSFRIMGTAANGAEVIGLLEKGVADVCLLDINMPVLDGMETAKRIRERWPAVRILMLTTYDDKEIIAELVHIGVAGYLLKNADRQQLMEAILRVMKGRYYFSEEVETIILQGLAHRTVPEPMLLTEREVEIVRLLAKELTNEKIARELHISYRTVESHRKNIMRKTKANNLAGLIRYAYEKRLIS